ncbi:sigma-70 family RNA polymerase sigma factor [Blautia producta]|uniref:RNA polymerase sigma factor SigS n=1 Tax=Blautia producta TaxID=33035 RepID=A0A4P6LX75_9FIRM|nr:sigma-70 family RNA polymerase sigma factor [Blautia producta]QBE97171.1 RNA polymerase sigma-H factor [Blautia producta]
MENYEHFTDEELIERLRDGEQELEDYLMEKYKGMVLKKAHAMFIVGGEREDLIQEGMIGLFKALRDYQPGKSAVFSTFANLCVERQLYKAIEMSGRLKNKPLNSYISLSEEESPILDSLAFEQQDPEAIVIDRENVNVMQEKIRQHLSSFETQVLDSYLEGMTYTQIAEAMEKSPKSIDNALQRIRGKIREFLE